MSYSWFSLEKYRTMLKRWRVYLLSPSFKLLCVQMVHASIFIM